MALLRLFLDLCVPAMLGTAVVAGFPLGQPDISLGDIFLGVLVSDLSGATLLLGASLFGCP